MNTSDEQSFLASYNIDDYERPSVAVDIAAFTVRSDESDNYKRDSGRKLALLLIKRGVHPFKDMWALPGGFLRGSETIEQCAVREITEESGVTPKAIMPVAVFSEPYRDPRGRVISNAFASVISEESVRVCGGDDASDAKWFDVKIIPENKSIKLILEAENIRIDAALEERASSFGVPEYDIIDSGGLAFDHAKIIACAHSRLRSVISNFEVLFEFLPEKFTLSDLQRVQEAIMNISLLPANFRRKASPYIEETDEYVTGAGHRPAQLFRRKQK